MTQEILWQLLLGGMMGLVGQGLRVIVGLKKLHDTALSKQKKIGDLFSGSSIVISLIIGFFAGILVVVCISNFDPGFFKGDNAKRNILSLVAAGYAGTDFIEGLIKKHLPNTSGIPSVPGNAYTGSVPVQNIHQPAAPAAGEIQAS